ncbi:MAG: glycosyltransferase, partial [Pseudomonadota bacterium]
ARVTGNPVRQAIAELAPPEYRMANRSGPLRLLIIGGSQGALALNTIVPRGLAKLPPDARPVVRHQAGRSIEAARSEYTTLGVDAEIVEFIDDMPGAWAWADLAICRSGALTVAELAAAGVPAILVPFPAAVDDHQSANARFLSDTGAAWLVQQSSFTPDWLSAQLQTLGRDRLLAAATKARALAMPDAAHQVAVACQEVMA